MKVNDIILTAILRGADTVTDEVKYSTVIGELSREINNDAICKYILSCAINICSKNWNCITFKRVLESLTSQFCIEKAYEYLEFFQNSHEHLEEIEYLGR